MRARRFICVIHVHVHVCICVCATAARDRPSLQASFTGTVHAILASWEVYDDGSHGHVMSTHPDETLKNFPRDMQWGQGLQLIEDMEVEGPAPIPFKVTAGEWLLLVTRFSVDGVTMQFQLERDTRPR